MMGIKTVLKYKGIFIGQKLDSTDLDFDNMVNYTWNTGTLQRTDNTNGQMSSYNQPPSHPPEDVWSSDTISQSVESRHTMQQLLPYQNISERSTPLIPENEFQLFEEPVITSVEGLGSSSNCVQGSDFNINELTPRKTIHSGDATAQFSPCPAPKTNYSVAQDIESSTDPIDIERNQAVNKSKSASKPFCNTIWNVNKSVANKSLNKNRAGTSSNFAIIINDDVSQNKDTEQGLNDYKSMEHWTTINDDELTFMSLPQFLSQPENQPKIYDIEQLPILYGRL